MSVHTARVPTSSGSRYMQQLAKHWSHRMAVAFDEAEAVVDFPNGSRLAMRADGTGLECTVSVPDDGDADRMRQVVEEHLNRFAFREAPLPFEWRVSA